MAYWLARSFHSQCLATFWAERGLPKAIPGRRKTRKSLASPRSGIRQTGSNQSGRISERGRVSEYLEESPRLLARPLPPKSWDVSRRAGVSSRKGFVG